MTASQDRPDTQGVKQTEGWYGPPQSRRFHYFRKGRSLCGKWMVLLRDEDVPWNRALGPASGDCAPCKRAVETEAQVVDTIERVLAEEGQQP